MVKEFIEKKIEVTKSNSLVIINEGSQVEEESGEINFEFYK